jgi:hypothetical protein
MDIKDFTEMINNSEKFKISSFKTDRSLESIDILANSYLYKFLSPGFDVVSDKDPVKLMKAILKKINTTEIMGKKLIDLIEIKHGVDLDHLKVDY